MKIYLIGMPGSGKSTVGRSLSKKLNIPFYDLDGLVEKEALMFTNELIEKYGIDKFRELETKVLKNLHFSEGIVACGGGIVENKINKEAMDGTVIYLDVNNELIEKRLESDYDRPLLKTYTIEELYTKRFLMYQHFATKNVSNEKTVEETVDAIIALLGKEV
ncbi:MAG TPA: shikimate kinase [Haploplasma sp.]|nr:shikimate kinase [Haploplasma sp.]